MSAAKPGAPRTVQVAIDCHDPHAQNRFWAELMRYEMEDHHDMIEGLLAAGQLTEDQTVRIDRRLAFATAAACRGGDTRLLFQQVPEGKTAKNRFHIDVHTDDTEDRDAVVARCIERGATKLWDGQEGPQTWVTLADPEGNEFCVN